MDPFSRQNKTHSDQFYINRYNLGHLSFAYLTMCRLGMKFSSKVSLIKELHQ